MDYQLTAEELARITALDAEQRYEYFIKAVADLEQIWILTDDEGFVLVSAEDERCIPVWPHAELAEQWIEGEWSNCTAQAVAIDTWLEKWTEGLNGDELSIAVLPDTDGPGVVVTPDELAETLVNELEDEA
ncbi:MULTISPECIES: DUF2750 domain-containing protein [unclassified Alishewanella]|mgnify:FL=1|jgi:hypothetical protein|uniref:DUF2750 domain-containing protein n=1 Tax=unclassified Alishewanella TaxID=2628974 RepID=UPI0008235D00|nr:MULTISPECIES: DUF2750 domain-containing protein [unclassified Alishewanella]MCT8126325.1 DUF2750 domain-containing protein [Alishewanella sp. BS5-314]OCW97522.1 hypothetical protein A9165_06465 [Alishewanella sp. HH-ZS]